jgi:Flp pilus assembly secretin CpaC
VAIGFALNHTRSGNASATQSQMQENDARIKQDIVAAFDGSDSLKHQKISVFVENGNVVLSGKVSRPYESEVAGDMAKAVAGVTSVKNDIQTVEAEEPREQVWRSQSQLQNSQPRNQTSSTRPKPRNDQQQQTALGANQERELRQRIVRGYNRLAARDFKAAERAFQTALELDPSNRAAQQGLRRAQLGEMNQ